MELLGVVVCVVYSGVLGVLLIGLSFSNFNASFLWNFWFIKCVGVRVGMVGGILIVFFGCVLVLDLLGIAIVGLFVGQ